MSGKQYSLDSRIDLVEAVHASQEEVEEVEERLQSIQDKENIGEKLRGFKILYFSSFCSGGPQGAGRGRSLSVVENSEVVGEVGMALRKARAAQMAIPEGEVEEENEVSLTTLLQPSQTATIVHMMKQVSVQNQRIFRRCNHLKTSFLCPFDRASVCLFIYLFVVGLKKCKFYCL